MNPKELLAMNDSHITQHPGHGGATPRRVAMPRPRDQIDRLASRVLRNMSEYVLRFGEDDVDEVSVRARQRILELAIQQVAQDLLDDAMATPEARRLCDISEQPDGTAFRIAGLVPAEGNMLLVAQRKAGKTVTALNVGKCLLDGTPFLGCFPVVPVAGTVAFLNYELSSQQFRSWATEMGMPAERLMVVNARGAANPLGSSRERKRLAEQLMDAGVESVVIDPFSVASTGVDANSPADVRSWLGGVEEWVRGDVGATDLILTAHAGWGSDSRARGASSLEDWADSIVNLRVKGGVRSLTALGRDVQQPELRLTFHPSTRLLNVAGPESPVTELVHEETAAPGTDLYATCLSVVRRSPGLSTSQIGHALRERGLAFRKGEENEALRALVSTGHLHTKSGPKGARLHYSSDAPPAPRP